MLEDRKVKIFLLTLAVALTAGVAMKGFVGFKAPAVPEPAPVTTAAVQAQDIVVYVTGAVAKSGLVKLPPGARLADALVAAGQIPESDLTNLNLAEKLKDGQKIVVPRVGAQANVNPGAAPNGIGTTSSASAGGAGTKKVNINTADAKELDTLPGIGPAMAERIITYREEKGPFQRPEDLKEVPGIGDKKFAQLADMVTVN